MIFRNLKSLRPKRALKFASHQPAVQPTHRNAMEAACFHGELARLGQRVRPRHAIGKPILAVAAANIRNQMIPLRRGTGFENGDGLELGGECFFQCLFHFRQRLLCVVKL